MKNLAIWVTSIFTSFILSTTFVFVVVGIAASNYEKINLQTPGEEDLALGMTVVLWFALACLAALPMWVLLAVFFKKVIHKYFSKPRPENPPG